VDTLERALDRLDTSPFDAILLDLNLPDSRGLETLSAASHRGNAALIVWTASEDEELASGALREGAEEFLVKGDVSGPAMIRRLRLAWSGVRPESRSSPPTCAPWCWVSPGERRVGNHHRRPERRRRSGEAKP